MKKGEQWSVLTVIIKCEISCTHPIVTIKDGCHRLIYRVRGQQMVLYVFYFIFLDVDRGLGEDIRGRGEPRRARICGRRISECAIRC